MRVARDALRKSPRPFDVHAATWDGPAEGAHFVCVHGLGGSHLNWSLLAPRLAARGRVDAPDLAGFGLTLPRGRRASVEHSVDLLTGFMLTVCDRPAVVVGNSLGGLLTLLLAARAPELVAGLVLVDPAVPSPQGQVADPVVAREFVMLLLPVVAGAMLRRRVQTTPPAEQVETTMRVIAAEPAQLDQAMLDAHIDLVTRRRDLLPDQHVAFLQAARSLLALLGPRRRRVWEAVDAITAPVLLLHGARDRLIPERASIRLASRRPDWAFRRYSDLGHVPMLEDPERVAADVLAWLPSVPRPALSRPRRPGIL